MTTAQYYRQFNFTNDRFIITHTRKHYERTATGKSWKATPTEEKTERVTAQHYTNYVTSIPFFNNLGTCRAVHNYTAAGYLPVTITSISPDKNEKYIDSFSFEYVG